MSAPAYDIGPADRPAGLHARLKRDTRVAHDRVEAAFALDRHLADRTAYRRLLERLHGLHRGFEDGPARRLAGGPLARPARSAALARDLRHLGLDADRIGRLPVAEVPSGDGEEAVGAAYVLEGSALGGLVIARRVADRLGLDGAGGQAFFAGDGRATIAGWRAFTAALDREAAALDSARVVAAALGTFALVEAWIAAPGSAVTR